MKNGIRKIYSLPHFVLNLGVIDEEDDPSLVELNIEPLNDEFAVELNNLRAQLQFHNMQMTQAALQNKEELAECEVQLDDGVYSKIGLHRIPADGNCLFSAIVHQKYMLQVDTDEFKKSLANLPSEVITHIKQNLQRYQRTISGRVYAHGCDNEKVGIQNNSENLTNFLDDYLFKNGTWAGLETIQAVSEIFKTNVIIFNEWGTINCGNSFDSS